MESKEEKRKQIIAEFNSKYLENKKIKADLAKEIEKTKGVVMYAHEFVVENDMRIPKIRIYASSDFYTEIKDKFRSSDFDVQIFNGNWQPHK